MKNSEDTRQCSLCSESKLNAEVISLYAFDYEDRVTLFEVCFDCLTKVKYASTRKLTKENSKQVQKLLRDDYWKGGPIEYRFEDDGEVSCEHKIEERFILGLATSIEDNSPDELTRNIIDIVRGLA